MTQVKKVKTETSILPAKPEEALQTMIRITEDLTKVMEEEARRLASMDATALAGLVDAKNNAARTYHRAAAEFHKRLEEFRKADPALLDKLENAQHNLGMLTRTNNAQIEPMTEKN